MKIAITGKGGVGKTAIAALLAISFEKAGYSVTAIDADPDANLATALNFPDAGSIVPLVEMKELIKERVGAEPGNVGMYFKLNPYVNDIPEKHAGKKGNIKLLVMGAIKKAGSGCACPENVFLKEVLKSVLFQKNEVAVIDMEAGIEHLGRGTAIGVDAVLIVTEPSKLSIETSGRILKLTRELGIKNIYSVMNKISDREDEDFICGQLGDIEKITSIPYSPEISKIYINKKKIEDISPDLSGKITEIISFLKKKAV
ncbi:MAG: P-loop NTPase [bacterium]|nr:P-loop NTPase [bacterium]